MAKTFEGSSGIPMTKSGGNFGTILPKETHKIANPFIGHRYTDMAHYAMNRHF